MRLLGVLLLAPALLASPASANRIQEIRLATKDILYHPGTQKIYASVPSSAGSIGNSITVIDPFTGSVGPSIFIGSEPGKLALSDDGQYLYVALDGAAAVRRFDVASQTAGPQFGLGADSFFGPYFVEDMAVLPGIPESVAISRMNLNISPRHAGVAIYDHGVQRPRVTQRHTGSNVIEFSAAAATLYGYNNETTEFGFRRLAVDASGVSEVDVTPSLITGFGVDMKFDGGLIYTTSGRVVDPVARLLVGTFPVDSYDALVAPETARGRVFFLAGEEPNRTLVAFDPRTFLPIGSLVVPNVAGRPGSLIRWGHSSSRDAGQSEAGAGGGLAFRTSEKQLFLIGTAEAPSADLAVSLTAAPEQVTEGQNLTYTITVTNRGPNTATGVSLTDTLPANAALVAVTVRQQGNMSTGGALTINLGALPPGARVPLTVVVRPSAAGTLTNAVRVNANEPDADPTNNAATHDTLVRQVSGPDLTGSWVAATQQCRGSGARLACIVRGTFLVRNQGSQDAPSASLRFFLSDDPAWDAGDLLLKQVATGGLKRRQTKRIAWSATLPKGKSAADKYIVAVVDAASAVPETDEQNNTAALGPLR